jgi:hypothetical protein
VTWKNSQAEPRGFLLVHILKHRVSGFVEELQFVLFGKDFNFTHGQKLTRPRKAGKRGFGKNQSDWLSAL